MKTKRLVSALMAFICLLSCFFFSVTAEESTSGAYVEPGEPTSTSGQEEGTLASGLIYRYNLFIVKKNSTTATIGGITDCDPVVVKCGFKNLKVQRRASSSDSWVDYYDYGNLYVNQDSYSLNMDLTVSPGYQYRVTCKHYAKKNILNTQTISNTSNIVTF